MTYHLAIFLLNAVEALFLLVGVPLGFWLLLFSQED